MECGINRPLTRFRKRRTFHSDYELSCWLQLLAAEMMWTKLLLIIKFSHEILKCHQLHPDIQSSDINRAVCPQCPGLWGKDTEEGHWDLIKILTLLLLFWYSNVHTLKNMPLVCSKDVIFGQLPVLSKRNKQESWWILHQQLVTVRSDSTC